MPPRFASAEAGALPLFVATPDTIEDVLGGLDPVAAAWARANGATGALGEVTLLPDAAGNATGALLGHGTAAARRRGRFPLAGAATRLPAGTFHLASGLDDPEDRAEFALGWLLAQYRFDRYRDQSGADADLVLPDGVDGPRCEVMAAGEYLTRDLINTPAADMGPDALEAAARTLADAFGAAIDVTTGDALLGANLPLIHAVGRTAPQAPRLIDLRWGDAGPRLTLVGKGICFDTGGLNLKPGNSMALMKKDMGGAATVLGLAHMIMALGLPLRLRVLVPAAENSIGTAAFRPGDILTSRKGLTVEINNTDAEGRLVLADALALADEDGADQIVSMATLTGAARVAVGPDIAPFYTTDDGMAAALGAARAADPVWRMPFHDPYEADIEPGIADLDNAPKGGFAGSITAALFLRRFVGTAPYTHFDIYGWQPAAAPARPKGGAGQGARALLAALPGVLGL